jgi:metal-responsive CopG/Arc/MetJ family transcriptional regulator
MTEDDGDDEAVRHAEITVSMPRELLRDIDEFATHNGYESPDAVVAAALEREDDEEDC